MKKVETIKDAVTTRERDSCIKDRESEKVNFTVFLSRAVLSSYLSVSLSAASVPAAGAETTDMQCEMRNCVI